MATEAEDAGIQFDLDVNDTGPPTADEVLTYRQPTQVGRRRHFAEL